MGIQKQKWMTEEEETLKAGVAKYGAGKWKHILTDPEFAPFLTHRSNIDLKDKWRNMSYNTAGSRGKKNIPRAKATATSRRASGQSSASALSFTDDDMTDYPSKSPHDARINAPRYHEMIFEALSAIKDSNGCDVGTIVNFIEQKHEVPPNFRRLLSPRLRRLVLQGKLEKVQNCYRIKKETPLGTITPYPKQDEIRLWAWQHSAGLAICDETVEQAAMTAANKIAESENMSFVAAEAVEEAERVLKMAEETNSMLQLAKEIYEQCSGGEIVVLV
ncbi:telomere repeat-binding factor 4-like [Diospyros lotus]|uniref:telomere repeat-binding factor 4-like n=1 Tax=Diospyros lotus TaxID=55363 RepID=UPI002250628B|nr:telomere repeat-binding factor 4-like [Diospyros lotus]